jgi:hypothetical protein
MAFGYVRPDESFMFGSVSGSVDATYEAAWLVNGSPNRPVAGASGLALTVTATSQLINYVAVINHNLTGTVAISGGVTATIPAATLDANGLRLNSGVAIPAVTASGLVVTVAESPSIIGEFIAGRLRTLERQLLVDPEFGEAEPYEWMGDASSIPPYDPGVEARSPIIGDTIVTQAGLDEIVAMVRSTRRGTRPLLILPIDRVNDPWLVTVRCVWAPHIAGKSSVHRGIYKVHLEFTEIPRVRWPA